MAELKNTNYCLAIATNSKVIWNFFEQEEILPKYQKKCKEYQERLNFLIELVKEQDSEVDEQYVQLRLRDKLILQVQLAILEGNFNKNLLELIQEIIETRFDDALGGLEDEMVSDAIDAKNGIGNLIADEINEFF